MRIFKGTRARARYGVVALVCATLVVSTLIVAVEAAPSPSAPWLMYGHDSAHYGQAAANGPTTAAAPAWSYSLGVAAYDNASPVLGPDGSIYAPSDAGFFALNPNGTLRCKRWGTSAFDWTATKSAPAVAADGTAVYVTKWPDNVLFALNPADCTTRWSYPVGRTTYGSPTIGADGTIYLGATPSGGTSRLYALNPDGSLKWQWDSGSTCWIESSVALGPAGEVYVGQNCLGLVKLTSAGVLVWARAGLGDAFNSPSVGGDGTIYIGSSSNLRAVNPDGSDRWSAPTVNWMYDAAVAIGPDGTIFRGDNGGKFYAFSSTGVERWRYDSGLGGQITSMPALSGNGLVYFTTSTGDVTALNTTTGSLVWKRAIGATTSSPALGANGTLYVLGSDSSGKAVLHAFAPPSDTISPTATLSAPAVDALVTRPVSITGTASDNVGVTSVKLSITNLAGQWWSGTAWLSTATQVSAGLGSPGAGTTSWSYTFNPPESANIYSVVVSASDGAGNSAVLPGRSFTTDSVAPNGTVTAPAANATVPKPVSITGTATDNVSVRHVRIAITNSAGRYWNGSTWVTALTRVDAALANPGASSSTWSYSFNPSGSTQTYRATVTVYDFKGSRTLSARTFRA